MKIAQQYFNRGNSKIFLKDYAGAIVYFDKGIEINPKFAKAYYQRGIAKNFFHDNEGSVADFSKVVEINPDDTQICPQRGQSMVYTFKDTTEAIADFDKAIEINPKFAKAYFCRGLAKNYFQNHAGVIIDYARTKESDSLQNKPAEKKGGVIRHKLKDYQGVIADFDKAIEIDPKFAEAYYSRGLAKNYLKNQSEIRYDSKQNTAIIPDSEASTNLNTYTSIGHKKNCLGAIADFDKAIEIDPGFAEAYYCRGIARNYLQSHTRALQDAKSVIEKEDRRKESQNHLESAINYHLKNYTGAIADFDMAIKINPNHAKAYYSRGLIKNYFQDYMEEVVNLSRSIDLQSEFSEANTTKELVMDFGVKNYSGAISDFDKAIEINPKFAKAYYHRGVVKIYCHDYSGAKSDFGKAIEIDPKYTQASRKLELLNNFLIKRRATILI
jgi:serine/threonine-protein kinase